MSRPRRRNRRMPTFVLGILGGGMTCLAILPFFLTAVGNKESVPDSSLPHARQQQQQQQQDLIVNYPASPRDDASSVDYIACCGLGHRLVRMADAFSVRTRLFGNFDFRSFWGWCGNGKEGVVEVFSTLFHGGIRVIPHNTTKGTTTITTATGTSNNHNDRPSNITTSVSNLPVKGHRVRFLNDVGHGYRPLRRTGLGYQNSLDDFCQSNHWEDHFVMGLHIRAGNGEGGDFARKGRQIDKDAVAWVDEVVGHLYQFWIMHAETSTHALLPPPLLFVATDTPAVLDALRKQTIIPAVIDWTQERQSPGMGVFFGQASVIANKDAETKAQCLARWEDAMGDMLLLSRADLVVAGRPSSFVQSLPMSLALGRPFNQRRVNQTYCEIVDVTSNETNQVSTSLQCFSTFLEWCCQHKSWVPEGKEFVHFLGPNAREKTLPKVLMRPEQWQECYPRPGFRAKKWCLPHTWSPPGF